MFSEGIERDQRHEMDKTYPSFFSRHVVINRKIIGLS